MMIVDRPKLKLEPVTWDAIPRGNSATLPFSLSRQNRRTGVITPYNLQGSILTLTAKSELFDGDIKAKQKAYDPEAQPEDLEAYKNMLIDKTAAEGLENSVFRITVDCDDPTSGAIAPLWVSESDGWGEKEVFHGMYGDDPKEGAMIFRIPKTCTFIDPGTYYFDIRIIFKQERTIGDISENPSYLLTYGTFDIYGTPTNRAVVQKYYDFGVGRNRR